MKPVRKTVMTTLAGLGTLALLAAAAGAHGTGGGGGNNQPGGGGYPSMTQPVPGMGSGGMMGHGGMMRGGNTMGPGMMGQPVAPCQTQGQGNAGNCATQGRQAPTMPQSQQLPRMNQ